MSNEYKLINGIKIAEKIKDENIKEREARKVGVDTHLYKCAENISENEILKMIDCLNRDNLIDGILVQLPLPKKFNTDKIIKAISKEKDVDFFHPENLKLLTISHKNIKILPPVFGASMAILQDIKCKIKNKKICIIANSDIFGKNFAKFLNCLGAQAETTKIGDKNLTDKTKNADILISAVGRKHFIKKEMIKEGAALIDVGIVKEDKKIYGDIDAEDVKEKAGFLTPVPGGVGPLTIAMLFQNTLELYKIHKNINHHLLL